MRLILVWCSMLQVMAVNLCVHCKFYKPLFLTDKKFGQCTKFPMEDPHEYWVTGKIVPQPIVYHYCLTARDLDHMCGKAGTLFEQKN